jgi:hypothetical protein
MTNQRRIFLVAGLAMLLASLVALGLSFRCDVPTDDTKARPTISASAAEPVNSESAGPTGKVDYLAATAAEAARFTAARRSAPATQNSNRVDRSNDAPSSAANSRNIEVATPLAEDVAEDETEAYYESRIPLVFLDHTGVLPDTPEVAATVQKLRQDFIDSTGAALANPADPNFAALWDQFQPTADEIFCAIFGTEACNALSITEAHQRGHF